MQQSNKLGGLSRSLVYLAIRHFGDIAEFLRHVGMSASVEHLKLDDFFPGTDRDLPESLGQLSTLEHPEINDCYTLERLPQSIGKLVRLERLTLIGCPKLLDLTESLETLTSLTQVTIECGYERAIGLGSLRAVEHLIVLLTEYFAWDDDDVWLQLWNEIGRLKMLKRLIFTAAIKSSNPECTWRTTQESSEKRTALEYLEVRDFPHLMELPAFMGKVPPLQPLVIRRESHWDTPYPMRQLPDRFVISDCPRAEKLPIFEEGVKKVVIQRCRQVENWRPSLDHVSKMQELEVTHDN